jgi:hypothetical protein
VSIAIATAAASLAVLFNILNLLVEKVAAASLRTVAPSSGPMVDGKANGKLTLVKCEGALCLA